MKTLQLIQGSSEWNAHRATHDNASDAPAMMNCSPHQTRNELLHARHVGFKEDVSAFTQNIYDSGHAFEALARPHAEKVIGQTLYPVTGTNGRASASFDGLTIDDAISWEHKRLNADLRAVMARGEITDGDHLPLMYRVQMEHQMMVSEFTEKTLFTASEWDGETLVDMRHCWYYPDAELRAAILQGWEQLHKDELDYVPPVAREVIVAKPVATLPALAMRLEGRVTVIGNLDEFEKAATALINGVKTDLKTDQDFADADAVAKACDKSEKDIDVVKRMLLSGSAQLDAALQTLGSIDSQLAALRIKLTNLVTTRKTEIKTQAISEVRVKFTQHLAPLAAEVAPLRMTVPMPDFAEAAKNKRTIESLQNGIDSALAKGKMAADLEAKDLRAKLAWFKANAEGLILLFADLAQLGAKPMEDFQLAVTTRIQAHEAAEVEKARVKALKDAEDLQKANEAAAATTTREAAEANAPIIKLEPITAIDISAADIAAGAIGAPATHTVFTAPRLVPAPTRQGTVIRAELNAVLDGLGDVELSRVLSFVKSRFLQEAA